MKKWSSCLALALALCLLAGCSLAQSERVAPEEDPFVGFHVVFGMRDSRGSQEDAWVPYGSEALDLPGLGRVEMDRQVLFGIRDPETAEYHFPGFEGLNAFLLVETTSGTTSIQGGAGLAHAKYSAGDQHKLEGTVYFRGGGEEQFVTLYRVYQTPDGRVYLDGTGNSYGGAGGFGVTEKVEHTVSSTGLVWLEEELNLPSTFEISLDIEALSPLTRLEVAQYDAQNALIHTQALPLDASDHAVALLPETAWALVLETHEDGTITRTSADRPTAPQSSWTHTAWTIGGDELGHAIGIQLLTA